MTSTNQSLLLQDAFFYAVRAANAVDYEGTFGDVSRTTAMRRAARKAREAGMGGEDWGFKNPTRLADAGDLLSRIESFALAHGIDARSGTIA